MREMKSTLMGLARLYIAGRKIIAIKGTAVEII